MGSAELGAQRGRIGRTGALPPTSRRHITLAVVALEVRTGMRLVFHRVSNNPLLTPASMPFPAAAVLNPGAAEHNGEVVLLLRVEDHAGYSSIYVARSRNGVTDWQIESEPILRYGQDRWRYEMWGCEDARVTYLPEEKMWYITPTQPILRGGQPWRSHVATIW